MEERRVIGRLFLLFTVIPALDLALLVQVGERIGFWGTVALVVGTGAAGALLARRAGLGLLRRLRGELEAGLPGGDTVVEGALVLVAAALLVTPGLVTDLGGLLLLLPPVRRRIAPPIARALLHRLGGRRRPPADPPPWDHPVA